MAQAIIRKSDSTYRRDIVKILDEANAKKKYDKSMNAIKTSLLKLIKKKLVEIKGNDAFSFKERISHIQDPKIREKFETLEVKYNNLKAEIDQVNSNTDKFTEYIRGMKKFTGLTSNERSLDASTEGRDQAAADRFSFSKSHIENFSDKKGSDRFKRKSCYTLNQHQIDEAMSPLDFVSQRGLQHRATMRVRPSDLAGNLQGGL